MRENNSKCSKAVVAHEFKLVVASRALAQCLREWTLAFKKNISSFIILKISNILEDRYNTTWNVPITIYQPSGGIVWLSKIACTVLFMLQLMSFYLKWRTKWIVMMLVWQTDLVNRRIGNYNKIGHHIHSILLMSHLDNYQRCANDVVRKSCALD
jgi:hypothetical protein